MIGSEVFQFGVIEASKEGITERLVEHDRFVQFSELVSCLIQQR